MSGMFIRMCNSATRCWIGNGGLMMKSPVAGGWWLVAGIRDAPLQHPLGRLGKFELSPWCQGVPPTFKCITY